MARQLMSILSGTRQILREHNVDGFQDPLGDACLTIQPEVHRVLGFAHAVA